MTFDIADFIFAAGYVNECFAILILEDFWKRCWVFTVIEG
jgi:hypothetical protein